MIFCAMANNPGKGSFLYVRVAAELVSADHMVGDKLPPYARPTIWWETSSHPTRGRLYGGRQAPTLREADHMVGDKLPPYARPTI
ncbi:MAG: hypothetical protein AB1744_02530, partial [Candidatus Zixiibacteriota bacterium]